MDMDVERSLVRLVDRSHRARLRTLLESKHGRQKFIYTLSNTPWFDERFVSNVRQSDSSALHSDCVYSDLVSRGAPEDCYVIRDNGDGSSMPLRTAIDNLCGQGQAILLVCIPGCLAYWEPELGPGAIVARP